MAFSAIYCSIWQYSSVAAVDQRHDRCLPDTAINSQLSIVAAVNVSMDIQYMSQEGSLYEYDSGIGMVSVV